MKSQDSVRKIFLGTSLAVLISYFHKRESIDGSRNKTPLHIQNFYNQL